MVELNTRYAKGLDKPLWWQMDLTDGELEVIVGTDKQRQRIVGYITAISDVYNWLLNEKKND